MPTLTADAGSEDASGAPGPARLTTRCCIDGAMPIPNSPRPRTATATTSGAPAEEAHRDQRRGHADRADDQRARGVGVGEATTAERADRRRDAVGEQEDAHRGTGDAGDLVAGTARGRSGPTGWR